MRLALLLAAAVAASTGLGCAGSESDDPAEIESALPSAPDETTDEAASSASDPQAWPGADRTDPGPPPPRVVVASGTPSGAAAGSATAPEPPRAGVDCAAIVDHIYEVLKKEMPAAKSDTLREREQQDREALSKMCPARATPAFQKCVLAQKSINGILRCDPITGSTQSTASALLEEGMKKADFELEETDDGGRPPKPIDLPDPVFAQ